MTELHRTAGRSDPVVIPMEEHHVDRVRQLWKARFGAPDELVDRWTSSVFDEGRPVEGFAAVSGGNVLGFSIAAVGDEDYVEEYIKHPDVSVETWPKTGLLHMLCVDQEHEGRGIGTELVKSRLQWLAIQNVGGVLAVSWHREDYRDSRPLFEKLGFDAAAVVDDFYESATDEVHCVDCDGACTCGATVFTREISKGGE